MPQPLIPIYLKKLKEVGISRDIPNISVENAQYICSLLVEKKPKHILEIGTANGYSTLWWSQTMSTYYRNTDTVPSETNYI
jgi:predicted O-methyltransferase YrrM